MKVVGFSFIRNAIKYDYPIVEAVQSILPLCDEFVVAVGKSDDATLKLIQQIHPSKIKIIETNWNDELREGGKVLAEETNKAFKAISKDADWAFYIQGDEVVHEKYLPNIRLAMEKFKNDGAIDGLLFKYLHFYGSYGYIGASSNWYKNEIRIIKNNPLIYSYKDAQGFRKGNNEKLRVAPIDAYIYHYGWVKDPRAMQKKQQKFQRYWHTDKWIKKNVSNAEKFNYAAHVKELKPFVGSHPKVIQSRIQCKNWQFDYDISIKRKSFKDMCKDFLRKRLHIDLSYRNYKLK